MRIVATLLVIVAIGIGAALAVIYGGLYNVAASDPHFDPVRWALDTTFHNSVKRQAEDIEAPALDDPQMVQQGASDYATMCAPCHGVPGQPHPAIGKLMRPEAPTLDHAVEHWEPHEVFWIVKHGVKMSGMPAWGARASDDKMWSIVAFTERLPEMSGEEYQSLIAEQPDETAPEGETRPQAQAGEQQQQAAATAGERDAGAAADGGGRQAPAAAGEDARTAAAGETERAAAEGDAQPAATVEMTTDLKYVPANVTIRAGETIEWVNTSPLTHTVTADPEKAAQPEEHVALPEGAEPFGSGRMAPQEEFRHTFTVPGTYRYVCIPHEMSGMVGTVEVQAAD